MRRSVLELTRVALFAALIAVCSFITVPMPGVPFTLQLFGVAMALSFLGGREGTLAVAVYLLLGLCGVPVFSGFRAGPAALFGTTGGYLVGFLVMGVVYWALTRLLPGTHRFFGVLRLWIALLFCYAFGTVWFVVLYVRNTGPIGVWSVLLRCVIPFLLPDLVKILLAVRLSGLIRARLSHGKT